MADRDPQTQADIGHIIDACTGVGSTLDELTLLRATLRAYADGMDASDAVAWSCQELSDTITKHPRHK
jgi:hypothetical protein